MQLHKPPLRNEEDEKAEGGINRRREGKFLEKYLPLVCYELSLDQFAIEPTSTSLKFIETRCRALRGPSFPFLRALSIVALLPMKTIKLTGRRKVRSTRQPQATRTDLSAFSSLEICNSPVSNNSSFSV